LQYSRRDLAGCAVLDALAQGPDLAWLDLVDGARTKRRQDVDLERAPDLGGVLLGPAGRLSRVPFLGDGKKGWRRRIGGLLLRLFGSGGVVELAGVLPLLTRLGEADLGVRAEAEGLLPSIDAVLAAPELATGRGNEQVQAVAVVELPRRRPSRSCFPGS